MTPSGEVIDLPQGATPLDFAYYIHTEVGNRCRGAKVNGRIVPLIYTLQSGESVEIMTASQGRPSRDWLNPQLGYLATQRARAKVRTWFRQQDTQQNITDGRVTLEHELQRIGVRNLPYDQLALELGISKVEELLLAIGRGDLNSGQIAAAVHRLTKPLTVPQKRIAQPLTREGGGSEAVFIQGVGNLLTQLSACCTPKPGDEIVGYITVGRGVTIHCQDCKNILNLNEEKRHRLIAVSWSSDVHDTYAVDIEIEAYDRKSLLRDVYTILAEADVNVTASQTLSDTQNNIAIIAVSLEVTDFAHLSLLLNRLKQLPNIIRAERKVTGGVS
ncbi:MAG: bifunctional (p)ppGpp synthetase/guanosine-3',5'-bis(diphosphate) 3'-pyrophosphohydrolase [Gammaproteobacteria bacterium]|nr:bifunctional (p)ppGpp synthetase/guanosine-3',5'-bis(diphosphate) 3'-pyrophosphohydrolase [Gammaproteobacteria bacterium]